MAESGSPVSGFNRYAEPSISVLPVSFLPPDSSYPEHLANSVNNTDTTLRALLSNTDTSLCARLSKWKLLSPVQYLTIHKISFFYVGAF